VLEGLLDYELAGRKSAAVTRARKRAENYLLERRMFRSLRTGRVIDKRWLFFSFPPSWHYDVLRGLDYLRNAGIKPDSRVAEAIAVVIARRHQNGRWPLNLRHPEHILLKMETDVGSASRWNTLRARRVLRWYNNSTCSCHSQALLRVAFSAHLRRCSLLRRPPPRAGAEHQTACGNRRVSIKAGFSFSFCPSC
jgi:hypothetical protein